MPSFRDRRPRASILTMLCLQLALAATLASAADQPAAAQRPADTAPASGNTGGLPAIGLGDLISDLLRDNPDLLAATARVTAAEHRISPAGALPNPELAWELERSPAEDAGNEADHLDPPHPGSREHRFRLTQEFPFPGKRGLMRSIMAEEAAMSEAERDQILLDLLAELHGAYYDLWFLHEEIAAMRESRDRMTEMAEVARVRYEVGRGMQQDLLKANVEAAMESARITVLEHEVRSAEARVNTLMGRGPDLRLGRPEAGEANQMPVTGAQTRHPSLRARDRAVAREQVRIRLADREGWPDFMAGAGYVSMRDEPDAWMAMLAIELPIWRGSKIGPAREEARADLLAAAEDLASAERAIALATTEATASLRSAETMADLFGNSVIPQAEQALVSARAAYEADRASFLDVLDAERSLLTYRIEHARARAEVWKSLAELGRASGDLDALSLRRMSSSESDREARP